LTCSVDVDEATITAMDLYLDTARRALFYILTDILSCRLYVHLCVLDVFYSPFDNVVVVDGYMITVLNPDPQL